MYAVFAPTEIAKIQQKLSDQEGHWRELLEKETNRFLSFDAEALVSHLLEEARYPKRKEMLDLEEANVSLDLAYQKVEEMEFELEQARGRTQNASEATGSTREDDRTRTRERTATERTDYWSNRSGRSVQNPWKG
jgi:hypothetical protein